uniref:Aryl hydrocarbon receptor n=1 Tax=Dreissena polymorpha TaxID=45954 RepID=Q3Y526_DREPO|nr:aryl hydrocarbon receptor [Dreissena polymorpha]
MVDTILSSKMYATKRRRRTVKSVKTPAKEPPKSNPSKRHRERLNGELDHLASLLPFEQSVISKLDKLSILRLGVSYLRAKSYFQGRKAVLPVGRYSLDGHHLLGRSHLFSDPGFSEGESILQALYGFLFVVTCDSEVFYASRTVEQYLGFHQSDIIHQSVMELIHSEDRDEFKRQLTWNSMLPADKATLTLHEVMMPENYHYLHRSFTVRFRCLLDNTSGFITLEISGWIRVMHGQPNHSDEPQLALFATCCPFGPLSLMDLPSRELTFKSKHKMDFAPLSMDNRGRMMFGYGDRDLAMLSGYDLIHPDDLNYFAAAHGELIKTGSAGLIAYRWLTKDYQWLWLQSSCKVIYKNSKPDFVIATHRQLTEDEGQDLFHKRGNEFKLPYPLLDLDMCTGFDFPSEDLVPKMKGNRNKKQKTQVRDFLQNNKKRKPGKDGVNGIYGAYPALNGYDASEYKPEFLYHYPGNNIPGLESDLLYNRAPGYSALGSSVYPATDPYRLDVEKHGYANGYYLDRQYQHTLSYHSNSYADLVSQGSKYAGYSLDTYSLDLAKKVHYNDDLSRLDNEYKKYGYDYRSDWFSQRLNGGMEPVDLRSSAMYGGALDPCTGSAAALNSNQLFKTDSCQSYVVKDSNKGMNSPEVLQNINGTSLPSVNHSSVIKNMSSPRASGQNRCSSVENLNSPNTNNYQHHHQQQQHRGNVIHNSSSWAQCLKSGQSLNPSPISNSHSESGNSPKLGIELGLRDINRNHLNDKRDMSHLGVENTMSGGAQTSVIHSAASYKSLTDRSCDKQPLVGGIPVPVVKSPWMHQFPTAHNSYPEYKDSWSVPSNDMYAYQRSTLSHAPKIAIP